MNKSNTIRINIMNKSKTSCIDELEKFRDLCLKGDEEGCMNMIRKITPKLEKKESTFIQYYFPPFKSALINAIKAKFTNVCLELLKYPKVCRLKHIGNYREEVILRNYTPLMLACEYNLEKVCMEMIKYPELCNLNMIVTYECLDSTYIDLHHPTKDGYTHLLFACKYGMHKLYTEILKYEGFNKDLISYTNSRGESVPLFTKTLGWDNSDVRADLKLPMPNIEIRIPFLSKDVVDDITQFINEESDMDDDKELDMDDNEEEYISKWTQRLKEADPNSLTNVVYETRVDMDNGIVSYALKLAKKPTSSTEKRKFDQTDLADVTDVNDVTNSTNSTNSTTTNPYLPTKRKKYKKVCTLCH